jgi:hypothetical protein
VNIIEYIIRARDESAAVLTAAKTRFVHTHSAVADSAKASAAAQATAAELAGRANQEAAGKVASLSAAIQALGRSGEKIPAGFSAMEAATIGWLKSVHALQMGLMRVSGIIAAVLAAFTAGYKATLWLAEKVGGYTPDKKLEEQARKAEEAKRATAELLEKTARIEDAKLDKVRDQYRQLGAQADAAAEAIERAAAADRKLAEANRANRRVAIDLDEATARRTTGGDPVLNARIDVLWGKARRDNETDAAKEAADAEAKAAGMKLEAAETTLALAEKERQIFEEQARAAERIISADRAALLEMGPRPESAYGGRLWDIRKHALELSRAEAVRKLEDVLPKDLDRTRVTAGKAASSREEAEQLLAVAKEQVVTINMRRQTDEAVYAAEAEAFNRALAERSQSEQDAAQKAADELLRLDRERAAEQRRLMLDNLRAQADAQTAYEADAGNRMRRAETEVARTWSWYKDKTAWKGELQAEREDAAAQVQFRKDAERLQGKFQWRTSNLSDEEEIVRRVLFAREEEAAARQALLQIEQNTRDLAAKVEALMALR